MAKAPGYNFLIPLPCGALRQSLRTPLEFLIQARQRFGDVVRFQVGPFVTHILYHPSHVARVLRDQQKNYLRGWQYQVVRRLLGDNLVVSEGDFWRRQRRLAQPAFHQPMLAAYSNVMIDATSALLDEWSQEADRNGTVEVAPAMSPLALTIAGRTLFGQDVDRAADTIGSAYSTLSRYLDFRLKHPFTSLPASWPTPRNRQFKRAILNLKSIVTSLIRQHRNEAANRKDLLSMLIQSQDKDTGERMTDDEMCNEALAFLIAGHETTAKGLTWTLYLLASNPTIRDRLRAEVATVLGQRRPCFDDVQRLESTQMAIEESLRLYPPAWVVARRAMVDDEIGGFHIPAKSTVLLSPYATHRHPEFWEQPDVFDIDRFSTERGTTTEGGLFSVYLWATPVHRHGLCHAGAVLRCGDNSPAIRLQFVAQSNDSANSVAHTQSQRSNSNSDPPAAQLARPRRSQNSLRPIGEWFSLPSRTTN